MRAVVYNIKPLGWLSCKALRPVWKGCVISRLGGLSLREIPDPPLPGEDWVRVRTLLGGICGTDLAILAQKQAPDSILQAFSSMPMLMGHENVAVVEEVGPAADKSWIGRRVCVEPTLSCQPRGIEPMCDRCKAGEFGACENFGADGEGRYKLPPGTSIGYNKATGGSFGERFVAHQSQLVPLDDKISDELAVLTDPLACSLHSVLRADLSQTKRVLVYGAGVLGLGIIACLRAIGYAGTIDALDHAAILEKLAMRFGADQWLDVPPFGPRRHEAVARRTQAVLHPVRLGNYMLSGGYDVIFECVGSAQSLQETLKWTRARGQVVMVATGSGRGADLTPLWFRELSILGAYGRQIERFGGAGVGTYQLVHRLMAEGRLDVGAMLTHKYPLAEYKAAFASALDKAVSGAIKVAFDFRK